MHKSIMEELKMTEKISLNLTLEELNNTKEELIEVNKKVSEELDKTGISYYNNTLLVMEF